MLVRPPADCHQARRKLEQLLCERFALADAAETMLCATLAGEPVCDD